MRKQAAAINAAVFGLASILQILLTQRIADLSNILAQIVDFACNLVRIVTL
jgi:hypothetical protein